MELRSANSIRWTGYLLAMNVVFWVTPSVAQTIPGAPVASRMTVTMNSPGSSDMLSGLAGAVGPGQWVYVSTDGLLSNIVGSTAARSDGSFAPFGIGDNRADAQNRIYVVAVDPTSAYVSTATIMTNDITPPITWIYNGPYGSTRSTSAVLYFLASETGATFQCRLDSASFAVCTSPISLTGLPEGSHTFYSRAFDRAGNVDLTPDMRTWKVDLTAPDTTITSTPPNPSTSTSATFTFTSTEPVRYYTCQIDNGVWTTCYGSKSYSSLTPGNHTFQVKAVDTAYNTDPTPASYTWSVQSADITPPQTTVSSPMGSLTNLTWASFTFSSTETPSTFTCNLDGATPYACVSPLMLNVMAEGTHTFAVYAVDAAGNRDATPATFSWTVDVTPPDTTITTGPPSLTSSTSATFSFVASETVRGFECRGDDSIWVSCPSPTGYSNLPSGAHRFEVRATDLAGNLESSPAAWSWTVDVTPPDTTITSKPSSPTKWTTAYFYFSATESGSTFRCSLDSGALSTCTSPRSLSGLTEGQHTFQVQATDTLGNADPTPASYTWRIDLTPPDTAITSAPPNTSTSTTASFAFSSSEPQRYFLCRLDGNGWFASYGSLSRANLAPGSHTLEVKAVDLAYNIDPTPATFTWLIQPADTTPPETTLTAEVGSWTHSTSAVFTFASTELGSAFYCQLDVATPALCQSPLTISALGEGGHVFSVTAVDAAGNADATPAAFSWTVDLTPPETLITSKPATVTSLPSATFDFSCSDPPVAAAFSEPAPCTFSCGLDSATESPCPSPVVYDSLELGLHTFTVRARDGAANADASPATYTWRITNDLTDADEPNDGSVSATRIALNAAHGARIASPGDIDWYTVSTADSGTFRADVSSAIGMAVALDLYDSNLALLASSTPSGNGLTSLTLSGRAAGNYYLKVAGASGVSEGTIEYTLTVWYACTHWRELDNTTALAGAATLDPVSAKLCPASDIDWYRIVLGETKTITATLRVPAAADFSLELYRQDLTLVGASRNGKGIPETVRAVDLPPGSYYLKVFSSDPTLLSTQPYTLSTLVSPLRVLALLVDFPDKPGSLAEARAHFDSLLFGSRPANAPLGSMADFYRENSYGNLELSGQVNWGSLHWIRLPKTYASYVDGQAGFGWTCSNSARQIAQDAAVAANNAGLDFGPYDNDNDGYVEGLFVVHAGTGGEVACNSWSNCPYIWSHRWVTCSPYETGDLNAAGRPVYVYDYTAEPEYFYSPGDMTIGVFAHEFGHALGLPDLYDTDYSSIGIGKWSVMASGSWNGFGERPAHFDAWSKVYLGFAAPTIPVDNRTVSIPRAEDSGTVFKLWTNGEGDREYFLLENRQKVLFDTAIPGSGLAIWHVSEDYADNRFEWYPSCTACGGFYRVALEQADGLWELERYINSGNAADLWSGNIFGFGDTSVPNSRSNQGIGTHVRVSDIGPSQDVMSATLEVKP